MNEKMKMLRKEARTIIADYGAGCDIDGLVTKLAVVGYRMMDAAAGL